MKKRVKQKKSEKKISKNKRVNWKLFFIAFGIVILAIVVGNFFTKDSVNSSWYEEIKPSITPPNYVFPIVWSILFALIAISFYLSLKNSEGKKRKEIYFFFIANLFLNVVWSVIFFGMQNPQWAFVELILLWLSIVLLIFETRKINKTSSWLLVPYLLWVSFAGILNWIMFVKVM